MNKEEILQAVTVEFLGNTYFEGKELKYVAIPHAQAIEAMDKYATEMMKSNATGIVNYIFGVCNRPDLYDKEVTIGEIKEAICQYAKQQSIAFFQWYGVKMVGFIEYITKVKPMVTSEEIEEKMKEFEGQTFENLYSLFLEHQNKQS